MCAPRTEISQNYRREQWGYKIRKQIKSRRFENLQLLIKGLELSENFKEQQRLEGQEEWHNCPYRVAVTVFNPRALGQVMNIAKRFNLSALAKPSRGVEAKRSLIQNWGAEIYFYAPTFLTLSRFLMYNMEKRLCFVNWLYVHSFPASLKSFIRVHLNLVEEQAIFVKYGMAVLTCISNIITRVLKLVSLRGLVEWLGWMWLVLRQRLPRCTSKRVGLGIDSVCRVRE